MNDGPKQSLNTNAWRAMLVICGPRGDGRFVVVWIDSWSIQSFFPCLKKSNGLFPKFLAKCSIHKMNVGLKERKVFFIHAQNVRGCCPYETVQNVQCIKACITGHGRIPSDLLCTRASPWCSFESHPPAESFLRRRSHGSIRVRIWSHAASTTYTRSIPVPVLAAFSLAGSLRRAQNRATLGSIGGEPIPRGSADVSGNADSSGIAEPSKFRHAVLCRHRAG
jgi:hypothetical protein